MTGPDRRVIAALDNGRLLDRKALRRTTRLAGVTLDVSLRKLQRMGRVKHDGDRYRLTAKGRHVAWALRTGSDTSFPKGS